MPANIATSTAKSVYQNVGKNLAPSLPLKELAVNKRQVTPNKLTDELRKRYKKFKEQGNEAFIENVNSGRMVSNLRSGKLLLMRSVSDGRYLFVKRDGRFSDNKTVGGQFQFYSTKLLSEWLSSQPELEPVCPSDDDQIEEFISAVKVVKDHYYEKFYTTDYETKENHSAQDFGTWITRYRYDPDEKDIVCELLDFPACRWDIRFKAEESSYFIYESKCSTAKLSHLLDDAEIQSDGEDNDNYGLRIREQLALTGGNVAGDGKENPYGTVDMGMPGETIVTEMWLQPEMYCDIDLETSESTVAGKSLPRGKSLLDMFPTGMCVVGINGLKTIIGLYAENHKEHIVSGVFHAQSFSGVGKGVTDAVDVTKELNDLHSQLLAHTKAHAMPGFGYNSDMITEEQARNIGKPRKNIPIAFSQAPDGIHDINQVVSAILPGNPASSAFEYRELLKQDLQIAFQTTTLSNGLPGVDNKTATGAKIGDQNAASVLVPQHLNKAETRKRGMVVTYNLFKRFIDAPKFFATKDKNGITAGKYISGSQFDGVDIDFEIVSNSQIPQKPYQQEDAMTKILQFTGGVPGLIQSAQMNPELTGEIVSAFGGKLSIPKTTDIARVCRKQIEQAKKLLQTELQLQGVMQKVTGQAPDNSNLSAQIVSQLVPPISPKELFVEQKIQWLAALLDDDEMQYAPQQLRYVIEEMIDRRVQMASLGKAQAAYDANMADVMGNMPMLLGQQAMTQANQQMENEFQQQQKQAEMQQQQQQAIQQNQMQLQTANQQANIAHRSAQANHQQALAQNDQQHANSMAMSNQEHAQALQQDNQSHANAMKLEAVKQLATAYHAEQAAKNQKVGAK